MTILVSHQAVPPHFTTKLRPCSWVLCSFAYFLIWHTWSVGVLLLCNEWCLSLICSDFHETYLINDYRRDSCYFHALRIRHTFICLCFSDFLLREPIVSLREFGWVTFVKIPLQLDFLRICLSSFFGIRLQTKFWSRVADYCIRANKLFFVFLFYGLLVDAWSISQGQSNTLDHKNG